MSNDAWLYVVIASGYVIEAVVFGIWLYVRGKKISRLTTELCIEQTKCRLLERKKASEDERVRLSRLAGKVLLDELKKE